jgi:hypothetical protein
MGPLCFKLGKHQLRDNIRPEEFVMMNRRSLIAKSIASSLAGRVDASFASSITDKRSLLIDSHVHVWKHDPAFPFAQGAHPPAEDASVETLLELMEGNAVDRTVLIQVIHYRWDNSYLANVLKRYPGRFKAVCRVNPEDPKAPDQLSRLTEEQGFHGVRISPGAGVEGDWIRGSLMPSLWRRCAQLKVPMTILTPVIRLPDLVPWIKQNPELIVVIDHMADCPLDKPNDLKLLTSLASYPKVLCGELIGPFVSNSSPIERQSIYFAIISTLFREKIMSRFSTRPFREFGVFDFDSPSTQMRSPTNISRLPRRRTLKPLMHLAAENELGLRRNAVTVADPEKYLVEAWNLSTGLFF